MIVLVRTPGDFARTLDADLCRINHWVASRTHPPIAMIEEAIDRTYTERAQGADAEALAAHIQDMAESLEGLQEDGLQLVAMLTRGHCFVAGDDGPLVQPVAAVDMADYLFAPAPCYFRRHGGDFDAPIHTLGADCEVGHGTIVGGPPEEREKTFDVWMSVEAVRRDFELRVPWCPDCSPEAEAPPEAEDLAGA